MPEKEERTIEGVIFGVMETYPLQLEMESEGKKTHVMLTEESEVIHGKEAVEVSKLNPKARVVVRGRACGAEGLVAKSIEVLEFGPMQIGKAPGAEKPGAKKTIELPSGSVFSAPSMPGTISPQRESD